MKFRLSLHRVQVGFGSGLGRVWVSLGRVLVEFGLGLGRVQVGFRLSLDKAQLIYALYLIFQLTVVSSASSIVSWLLQLSLLKWMADHQYQHQSSSLLIPAVRCLRVSISKIKMIQFELELIWPSFGMSFMNS